MKQFKKTIFWFIALAAIFGSYLLIENRVEESERVEQAILKLFPFEIDDVAEFWITDEKETRVRVVRQKGGWWLDHPLKAKGDDEAITKMLENIVKARKDAVLFENPEQEKLEELGLAPPNLSIAFRTGSGVTTLQFGDKGPTLNVTYGRFEGEPAVYRVHSDVKNESDTSVYALRDKTTLAFDPTKLRHLKISRRDRKTIEVVHDQGRWDVVQPEPGQANQATVLEVLFAIKDTPVKAFVAETSVDLTQYGLNSPAIVVTVLEEGKEEAQLLRIGDRDRKQRGYFAISNENHNIVLLDEKLVKTLLRDDGQWGEGG
ncbi:MAG: DUF4340 domain-containing protein [bacterium]|nr:DUF4340 domain-containing protein [bacterium]